MAVKGADVILVGNDTVLLDRLQTAGPGTVNIRRTTISELGNRRSVGSVPEIPDLQFSMESFDVSAEMEAFLLDVDLATTKVFDPAKSTVVNIKGAFLPAASAPAPFDTVASAAIPCLRLEQLQFRFGVGNADARQTASLRGDSLYYNPASTYIQRVAGTNTASQAISLTNAASAVVEGGVTRWTLAVTAGDQRLNLGVDYTEAATGSGDSRTVIVTILAAVPTTSKISVTYASPVVEVFPQSVHALVTGVSGTLTAAPSAGATTVTLSVAVPAGTAIILDDVSGSAVTEVAHVLSIAGSVATLTAPLLFAHSSGALFAQYVPTVKPAAIRGRDIDVYIGPSSPTPATPTRADMLAVRGTKRGGVQSVDADWRVTLQNDEELGNPHYTNIDFDVPTVTGTVGFRPANPGALLRLVQDLSGAIPTQSATSAGESLVDVQIDLRNPLDGRVLKTVWCPDARFSLPGYSGRVQQKLDLSAPFTSDQGLLYVVVE